MFELEVLPISQASISLGNITQKRAIFLTATIFVGALQKGLSGPGSQVTLFCYSTLMWPGSDPYVPTPKSSGNQRSAEFYTPKLWYPGYLSYLTRSLLFQNQRTNLDKPSRNKRCRLPSLSSHQKLPNFLALRPKGASRFYVVPLKWLQIYFGYCLLLFLPFWPLEHRELCYYFHWHQHQQLQKFCLNSVLFSKPKVATFSLLFLLCLSLVGIGI